MKVNFDLFKDIHLGFGKAFALSKGEIFQDWLNELLSKKIETVRGRNINFEDLADINTLMNYASDLGYFKAHGIIKEAINAGKSEELWNYLEDNYSDYNLDDLFSEIDCFAI